MKKIFIAFLFTFISTMIFAQNLSKVTISSTGNIEKFSFGLNENVLLNISKDG